MPVVRGRDRHRVDGRIVEQLAEVLHGGGQATILETAAPLVDRGRIDVAHAHDLGVRIGEPRRQVRVAAAVETDDRDPQPLVRTEILRRPGLLADRE